MLAAVLVLVWIASFFVPAGAYDINPQTASPVPGRTTSCPRASRRLRAPPVLPRRREAAKELETAAPPVAAALPPGTPCVDKSFTFRFKQLWDSTPNGLYGVESTQGFVGPWEEGFLYGSAAIFLFVLAVGAFITVTMKTEAIQTGIGRLALRFRHSGSVLIAILMRCSRSAAPPTGCGRRRSASSC